MNLMLDYKLLNHNNLTLRKVIYFGISYGVAYPFTLGLMWVLTEKAGLWYMASAVISGILSFGIRFLLSATWTFRKY